MLLNLIPSSEAARTSSSSTRQNKAKTSVLCALRLIAKCRESDDSSSSLARPWQQKGNLRCLSCGCTEMQIMQL
eukprot:880477-Pleurochrysis_carterae.AAC.1